MELKDIPRKIHTLGPVKAICNREIPKLCAKPYHGHPKGCPNVERCSKVPFFLDRYAADVYVVALEFNFGDYRRMMAERNPGWSEHQLRCPIYWQGHLRKELRNFVVANPVEGFLGPLWIPEAMGVDVTETCKQVGIKLQWPPMEKSYMVVLYVRNWTMEDQAQAPPRRSAMLQVVDDGKAA